MLLPTGVNVRTHVSFIGPFAVWMVIVVVTEGGTARTEEVAAWRRAIAAFAPDGTALAKPENNARQEKSISLENIITEGLDD
jgi:hypothetical protein